MYFSLPDLGKKFEENLDDLQKPPVDISYVPDNVDDDDLVSFKEITQSNQSQTPEKNESSGDDDNSLTNSRAKKTSKKARKRKERKSLEDRLVAYERNPTHKVPPVFNFGKKLQRQRNLRHYE